MEHEKYSVSGTYGQGFELVPYDAELTQRKRWRELITLYEDKREYGMLSATWFQRCVEGRPNAEESKELRNGLRRFFRNVDAKPYDVMWTVPKNSREIVSPKAYKLTRALTEDEMRGRDQEQLDSYIDTNGLRCWVASNARATNRFSDRHVLAYMLNLSPNPEIVKSFAACEIPFSRDEFALSGLIQWVWRSAIRKGEPITLYMPSPRMYRLFSDWLDGRR